MTNRQHTLRLAGLALLVGLVSVVVFFGSYLARDLMGGIFRPYEPVSEPNRVFAVMGLEWRMHPLDRPGDRLPRGLEGADLDGDGREELLTVYRSSGAVRVALPGEAGADGEPWAVVEAARLKAVSAAGWGDFDGDGAMDIIAAHADANSTGVLSILWGGGGAEWSEPAALPAGMGAGPFTRLEGADLDGDGDDDFLAGGDATASPRWYENPGAGRELSGWSGQDLTSDRAVGAGYTLSDLDGDGKADLVGVMDGALVWLRNPGGAQTRQPWTAAELYRGEELSAEGEVTVADLDGDGWNDALTQSEREVLWLRGGEDGFSLERIAKQQSTWWRSLPLTAADLNGDGRSDIAGGAAHTRGALIRNIAAVWWLERTEEGWYPHVIKWGDGFWGLGAGNGEKWAQLRPADVDGDGDLDLTGLVEEYDRGRAILSAVWFENPQR